MFPTYKGKRGSGHAQYFKHSFALRGKPSIEVREEGKKQASMTFNLVSQIEEIFDAVDERCQGGIKEALQAIPNSRINMSLEYK